jgi:hypothetical protein
MLGDGRLRVDRLHCSDRLGFVNECKTEPAPGGNCIRLIEYKQSPLRTALPFAVGESLFIKLGARLATWFALASLCAVLSGAQQTTPPSSPEPSAPAAPQVAPPQPATPGQDAPSAQAPADKDKKGQAQEKSSDTTPAGTSKDRLFFALPNFLSLENGGKVPPLTTKEKFAVVARGTFDPVQYPWWGFLASISQANNSEPAYGQGWEGYGKRYATTAADSIVENFMAQAIFPSMLHQDPRFFQSGEGGFVRRSGYAVSRIFVTRGDSGRTQFNYSEVFGSATAAAISTFSYHPRSTYVSTPTNPHLFIPSDRTLENAAQVWGTQVGLDTFTIFLKEFWPDIHRKMSRKPKVQTGSTTPTPAPAP